MLLKLDTFDKAYQEYYFYIDTYAKEAQEILEIGGGRHPSLSERKNKTYTVVDPDFSELEYCSKDIEAVNSTIENYVPDKKFDLIISKMVLEHIENPNMFHKAIKGLLAENGKAIHFFACTYSIPAIVNKILPERLGKKMLKILQNRNLDHSPKYIAYYNNTLGPVSSQLTYFENLGFKIEVYKGYVGHKYFNSIFLLRQIEQLYTKILGMLRFKHLSTVGLVVLSKR